MVTRFTEAGVFTAGFATLYPPGPLVGDGAHQHLAEGFPIGMRFQAAPVVRIGDSKPTYLGHAHEADGRWRLYLFADPATPEADSPMRRLCEFLAAAPDSPVRRYTPPGADVDAVLDVRGVYQQVHRDVTPAVLPEILFPAKGSLGLRDYEKAYAADPVDGVDIYAARGIDRARGAMVLVRPDQYVAHVLPLDAHAELTEFLGRLVLG